MLLYWILLQLTSVALHTTTRVIIIILSDPISTTQPFWDHPAVQVDHALAKPA